jgi:hypothetical protein
MTRSSRTKESAAISGFRAARCSPQAPFWLVWRPALAQIAGRNYHLGFVVQPARPQFAVLFDELQRRGFIEGSNLSVDPRGFGLAVDELEAAAAEVAKAGPDAIYCGGDAAGRAAQRATAEIPIVVTADDIMRSPRMAS